MKTTQQWFAAQERGLAVAIFNCGSAAGAVAAPLLITALTLHFSWRYSFVAAGALGLVWALPWLFLTRGKSVIQAGRTGRGFRPRNWWNTFKQRNTLALMGTRFFADPIWIFFVFWLPDYLSHARQFSLKQIGATAWFPFLTAGIGNLVGGWISDSSLKKGLKARSARLRVMAIAAIVMLSGIAVPFLHSATAVLGLISLVTFSYSCWAANVLTLPADLFEDNEIASVVGLTGTAAGCGGILVMLIVGVLLDRVSYVPVLIGISCMPLLAFFCSLATEAGETA